MKKFGLIGGKLGHSFSPVIHGKAMKKMKVEGQYSLIEVSTEEIKNITNKIRSGELDGINVTIPHKLDIMKHLDIITEEARVIGAVNTVKKENGKLVGYNTDYWGFRYTVEKEGIDLEGKTSVVLGGGGSARAVIKVAQDLGSIVYLVSRNPERAKVDFKEFEKLRCISYEELKKIEGELIVNTTPLGMYPKVDGCAIDKETAKKYRYGIDLVYNPKETKFLSLFDKGVNGLYMLVGQAIKAEEIWANEKMKDFDDIYSEISEIVYKKECDVPSVSL